MILRIASANITKRPLSTSHPALVVETLCCTKHHLVVRAKGVVEEATIEAMGGMMEGVIAVKTKGEMEGETAGEMLGEAVGEMIAEAVGETAGETAGEAAVLAIEAMIDTTADVMMETTSGVTTEEKRYEFTNEEMNKGMEKDTVAVTVAEVHRTRHHRTRQHRDRSAIRERWSFAMRRLPIDMTDRPPLPLYLTNHPPWIAMRGPRRRV